jgi:hypothetical protein
VWSCDDKLNNEDIAVHTRQQLSVLVAPFPSMCPHITSPTPAHPGHFHRSPPVHKHTHRLITDEKPCKFAAAIVRGCMCNGSLALTRRSAARAYAALRRVVISLASPSPKPPAPNYGADLAVNWYRLAALWARTLGITGCRRICAQRLPRSHRALVVHTSRCSRDIAQRSFRK